MIGIGQKIILKRGILQSLALLKSTNKMLVQESDLRILKVKKSSEIVFRAFTKSSLTFLLLELKVTKSVIKNLDTT